MTGVQGLGGSREKNNSDPCNPCWTGAATGFVAFAKQKYGRRFSPREKLPGLPRGSSPSHSAAAWREARSVRSLGWLLENRKVRLLRRRTEQRFRTRF